MLELPYRREYGEQSLFVEALNAALAQLKVLFAAAPVLSARPEWTLHNQGRTVFQVSLPTLLAKTPYGEESMLRSLIVGLRSTHKTLVRIARVEMNDLTIVWAEIA
jgi:hypothetical protein